MDWLSFAERALKTKKPLHINEMAEIVAKLTGLALSNEEIAAKLGNALSGSVKRKETIFSKVKNPKTKAYKKGYYTFKKSKPPTHEPVDPDPAEPISPIGNPNMETQFIGKGGEYAVLSELLFRKYNASIMTVDDGIDIVASKGDKYFHLQVKTAIQKNKAGELNYTIKESSFQSAYGSSTFYVFVFRREYKGAGMKNDFIVLPNSLIEHMKVKKVIKGSSGSMSIRISIDLSGSFMLNKTEDVTPYVNKFESMK